MALGFVDISVLDISSIALDKVRIRLKEAEGKIKFVESDVLEFRPEAKYRELIPERDPAIRGPVNFFRPEYGRWWLIEKTGDEHFERQVPLAKRGDYVMYEALNFADGKRSVLEIRDAVSAEFDSVPVFEVAQYFEFLEKLGVVRFISTKKAAE